MGTKASAGGALFVFLVLDEILSGDLLLRHRGELDQEIDHLLLEDGRSHPRDGVGILPVILPDLLLAPWNLTGTLDDRARDLILGHGNLVFLTDLRKHKAEAHAALGNAAIFLPGLLLGGALIGKGTALCLEVALD